MPKKILLVSVCLFFLAGCGLKKNQQQAAAAIAEYHKHFNEGAADVIYDGSSTEFKKAMTREKFTHLMQTLSTKLGTHVSSEEPGVFVNWTTNGTFVKATCESKFSKADASETFQFKKHGEKMLLVGFNVNSSALLE